MSPGFLLDHARNSDSQTTWVEGLPERNWLGLKLSRKEKLPVVTYRCTMCGYLESYANAEGDV
jgi:hypothetical protein